MSDVSKTNDLIAEARERHEPEPRDQLAKLIYEGHPDSMYSWDELDSRGKIWPLRAAGAILAAGFSRATVPDAATAAVDRVRAAVEKHKHWNEGCGWDVPTIEVLAALDGAPEPEWEVQYGRRNRETGALHWLTGDPRDDWWHENQDRYEHVKRYTSPPLPVEGESKS